MITQDTVNFIKQFEGCVLKVYLDPVGVPTAGFGHTKGLTKAMVGMPITKTQAEQWLKEDLAKFEKKVDKYNPTYHWTEKERGSLISFAFNVGSIDGLTAKGTRTKPQIAECMLSYCKAGGKVLKGLQKRREAERALFLKGSQHPTLRRGSSGNAVKELQRLLGISPTGIFGCETEIALKAFQEQNNLVIDGICGKCSWAKLLSQ